MKVQKTFLCGILLFALICGGCLSTTGERASAVVATPTGLLDELRIPGSDLYLDFLDGTPQQGVPIRYKARAKTGNAFQRFEFLMDSLCPLEGGQATSQWTVMAWSYVEGTAAFRQSGTCKVRVVFKTIFNDGTTRIFDRDFDIYVMG